MTRRTNRKHEETQRLNMFQYLQKFPSLSLAFDSALAFVK